MRKQSYIKVILIGSERITLPSFSDGITSYIKTKYTHTHTHTHTQILEFKSNYSKVSGYKNSIQKSIITFLYINNKQVKFEIKNTMW